MNIIVQVRQHLGLRTIGCRQVMCGKEIFFAALVVRFPSFVPLNKITDAQSTPYTTVARISREIYHQVKPLERLKC